MKRVSPHTACMKVYLLLVLCFQIAQSASIRTRQTCAFVSPSRVRHVAKTRLSLSSLKLNDPKRDDEGDEDKEETTDSDEFPNWVRGLRQWPLYPSTPPDLQYMPPPSVEEEKEALQEARDASTFKQRQTDKQSTPFLPIPLTNLLNVEALLMASGEETMESEESDLKSLAAASSSLGSTDSTSSKNDTINKSMSSFRTPLTILPELEELGWNRVVDKLVSDLGRINETSAVLGGATDLILKETTSRIEYFLGEASTIISPAAVQDLVVKASQTLALNQGPKGIETAVNDLVKVAEKLAREQGLNVRDAADRARETTKYTANLVTLANGLLVAGYAKDVDQQVNGNQQQQVMTKEEKGPAQDLVKPLFGDFETARMVSTQEYKSVLAKGAEMGSMSGAIYENTLPLTHEQEHSLVANGTSMHATWMITDSIGYQEDFGPVVSAGKEKKPIFIRTVTISGFDASDDSVDREEILNDICTATPVQFSSNVLLHSGLLEIAKAIYADVASYIDATAPTHKIVISGHSVGGSLSTLLLFFLTKERGTDFVKDKILRVYTFGSPPVSTLVDTSRYENDLVPNRGLSLEEYECKVLEALGLPPSMVYGYVQPWDPVVRLFSSVDPLYPLVGDIGLDGVTPYASGPPRSLRPILRAIVESWEGWPRFRDTFKATVSQNYTSVGVQHVLLPEPARYLSDRLVSVNVQVPEVDAMVRISSEELLPALTKVFPLDVFQISFVPSAIRSVVHHFFPAYVSPIVNYADYRDPSKEGAKTAQPKEAAREDGSKPGGWPGAPWFQI